METVLAILAQVRELAEVTDTYVHTEPENPT